MRRLLPFLLVPVLIAGGVALAGYSRGSTERPARVEIVDGDTFRLDGARIRLFGIDAPEQGQSCAGADGRRYDCGRAATEALTRLIGSGRPDCTERDRDNYGRSVAVCTLQGRDLNRAMVAEGWAVAFTRYSRDYVGDEAGARRAQRGLWQGPFERPDVYRAGHRRG